MKHRASILFFSLLFQIISLPASSFEGPLAVKNGFPLSVHLDAPRMESAVTGNSLSMALMHSSVFLTDRSARWQAELDMELTEFVVSFRKEIHGLFEIGVDIPLISLQGGFLDGPLESYHDTFGFPDYGRSGRPSNAFLYELRRDGVLITRGESDTGIGDIRLSAKKRLSDGDPVISVRADLELPTGDAKKGLGNGKPDAGVSALLDKKIGEKIMSYWNAGVVFPGGLRSENEIDLNTYLHAGAGLEAALWSKVSLLAQVLFQSSPFPDTGIGAIDRPSILLSFGARYSSGRNNFEFSVSEDPNTAGAPDFTVGFAFKTNL